MISARYLSASVRSPVARYRYPSGPKVIVPPLWFPAFLPNDTISRAIKKGAGLLGEKVDLELITYEGFAPHKVPVIVECLTDNKNRTNPEIRVLFSRPALASASGMPTATLLSAGKDYLVHVRDGLPRRER